MNPAIETVLPYLRNHQKYVLTTHVNPDGDGLGCEIALAEWMVGEGKQVSILNASATPGFYLFLDPHRRIQQFSETRDPQTIREADVILILDTNHPERLRAMEPHVLNSSAVKICIDHHLEAAPFAKEYLLDEDATSTGEILYHLLLRLNGKKLTPLIAQALYCAIMTDTGSFRYPRVDPEVHTIVAHLIEMGADPVAIYRNVYEQWSVGRIRLLGETLASLTTLFNGRLAHVTVTQEALKRTGTTEVDTDNFTTYPMSVEGVQVGILFLEMHKAVKISFRSKGELPINELAKEFGGNGHKNAAGARMENVSLAEVKNRVFKVAERYLPS
jgi:bifunctional oligoribonuclease and PAP phosphatase NrnA